MGEWMGVCVCMCGCVCVLMVFLCSFLVTGCISLSSHNYMYA